MRTGDRTGTREAGTPRAVYGRARPLGDVEFLAARFAGHRFTPHTHPVFAVGAVRSGACRVWHRGTAHVARRGDLVLMDPGAPHSAASAEAAPWHYCALYFPEALARTLTPPSSHGPAFGVVVGRDPELAAGVESLCALLARDPEAPEAEAALVRLVRGLFERFGRHGAPSEGDAVGDDVAWTARRWLDDHFAETVRLEHLSVLTGHSSFSLIRRFSRAFGMPPYTYLTHVRVARAQELLRAGHPISDTAFTVGFSDQSHLTRFFRRIVGVPPGVWVRGVAG